MALLIFLKKNVLPFLAGCVFILAQTPGELTVVAEDSYIGIRYDYPCLPPKYKEREELAKEREERYRQETEKQTKEKLTGKTIKRPIFTFDPNFTLDKGSLKADEIRFFKKKAPLKKASTIKKATKEIKKKAKECFSKRGREKKLDFSFSTKSK